MKVRTLIAALMALAISSSASAQSVSGLSVKTPQADPAASAERLSDVVTMANALARATTPELQEELRQKLKTLLEPAYDQAVNLAVPAGVLASLAEDGQPGAGARLGLQAWKLDDFFAGAFFTFDSAPTLGGDVRKAGQFLRDPPGAGTSLVLSGNRMFLSYRCGRIRRIRPARNGDNCKGSGGRDALIFGVAIRAGATSATFQHTVSGEGEDDTTTESREATLLHVTPLLLMTSRTFRDSEDGEFQFGLEVGRMYRWVRGDAGQDPEFLARPEVLGHAATSVSGEEATFFVRLNSFQPFVRLTRVGLVDGRHVPGLTGWQTSVGVSVQSSLFQTAKEK